MDYSNLERRRIDFLVKGLHVFVRQEFFNRIMDRINPLSVEHLLEKPEGYPYFKSISYSEEMIDVYLRARKKEFDAVNEFMIQHGRCPIFSNTEDSYQCALEYKLLMERKPLFELEKEFGCSYADFVPLMYEPEN